MNAAKSDVVGEVVEQTSGGVDYAFECIGNEQTIRDGIALVRAGGKCVLIGLMPVGAEFPVRGFDLVLQSKTLMGSLMGSNRFRIDIPRLVGFYLAGKLNLDDMISQRIQLADLNGAFDRMRKGEIARDVVVF